MQDMAADEVAEHAANENVSGEVFSPGDAERRRESRQTVGGGGRPAAVTVSSGYNRRQSPGLGSMAGRKRAASCKEFTIGIMITQGAARLCGPRALAGSLQHFNDDHAIDYSL